MGIITALIEGVLLGGYYAMIACGLSFMFGVMRIINLAHGSLAIVAAFALWTIADRFEYDPFLALIVVLPVMGGLGWLLQRGILERSARSGELIPILSTFGLAIVVENVLFECFGADIRSLAPYVGSLAYDSFDVGGGSTSASWRYSRSLPPFCYWAACNYFSPTPHWDAKSAPRQKIQTPRSSSASIRGSSTPWLRLLRWSRLGSPVCFSRCERISILIPARCSSFSHSRRE